MGHGTTFPIVGLLWFALAMPVSPATPVGPGFRGELVQDADSALREFQRAFKPARDPLGVLERRKAALAALAGDRRPAAAKALIDAHAQVEKELLGVAKRHLAAVITDQAANGFEHRPELDAQRALQDGLLAGLDSSRGHLSAGKPLPWGPEAAAYLFERALEDGKLPFSLRLGAARAAIWPDTGSPKLLRELRKALSRASREPEDALVALAGVRAVAAGAGFADGTGAVHDDVLELLESPRVGVRRAAAEALVALAQPGSIEPLIEALERAEGRERRRTARALEALSGLAIGSSAEAWRRWLEREGAPYLAGEVALGAGTGAVESGPASEPDESARYHGIPLEGEALLFVLDRSRSMNKRVARARGRDDSERRFDRAKAELVAALESLDPGVEFGLVAFGSTVRVFEQEPLRADRSAVKRAVEWIDALELQVGTNVYGALETAFHLAGRGAEDRDFEPRYDTLFLLSDGVPFVGGGRDSTERILFAARRWNAGRELVLHTIGLGDEVPADFMGALAREHNGRFVLETGTGSVDLSRRPNLVLFLVDDLGWRDVGFAGNELIETPSIDRLASEGTRFENAYSNAPNCAPSRASLLTGVYSPRHRIYTVQSSARGPAARRALVPTPNTTDLDPGFSTLAEVLAAEGYATGMVGKWHLGGDPREHGFQFNAGGFSAGHPKSYFSPYGNPALEDGPSGEFLTERLTDEALDFVRANADQPFFLYVSHYGVHTPLQAPEALERKYIERLPGAEAGGLAAKRATYAAMVESVDASLGRVLGLLDELDLAENTVVCFTSDNGALSEVTSMEPLRGQKGTIYEAGLRVPLVVRWPGRVAVDKRLRAPVIGSDLFATLAQFGGAPTPPVDGESLAPLLLGDGSLDRQAIFWHFPAYLEPYGRSAEFRARPCGAIRRGRFKLIEFFEDGRLELYDLREDPGETTNLADERRDLRDELHGELKDWRIECKAPVPTERNPEFER